MSTLSYNPGSGTVEETINWMPVDCTEVQKYICEVPKGTPVKMHVPPSEWNLSLKICNYAGFIIGRLNLLNFIA